jgi:hypothetical protein
MAGTLLDLELAMINVVPKITVLLLFKF